MNRTKIISNFFLDGAKIIFGSLVVGAFLPGAVGSESQFLTISGGLVGTVIFLFIADFAAKNERI